MPAPEESPAEIDVVVTHALPQRAVEKVFRLTAPATLAEALRLAAADPVFADVDIANATVGVFGRIAGPAQILENRDRIEIYRPLAADPKSARRTRASEARRKP